MRHKGNNCLTYLPFKRRGGFSLIELIIVIAIIIIFSAISMPYLRDFISSQRLQEVSWQIVQDLKSVKEDAILYQQDLNIYINYNNLPVEPMNAGNKNNRSYLFETFQWGQDQTVQVKDQHYIPTDAINSHFTERVLKYNIIIDSITSGTPSSIQIPIGKNYFVICFRSGAGSTFRGEGDVVTSMSGRTNSTSSIIDSSKLVIKLKDTSSNKVFYVIVDGTGEISMNGSPP